MSPVSLPRPLLAPGLLLSLALLLAGCTKGPPEVFACFPGRPDAPIAEANATVAQANATVAQANATVAQANATGDTFAPGELLVGYALQDTATQNTAPQNSAAQTTTPTLHEPTASEAAFRRLERDYALTARTVRDDLGLEVLREGDPRRPELVRVADVNAAAAALRRDPRIRYAHPNYYLTSQAIPNDPLFGEQWNLAGFGLPDAWNQETGTNTVVVAVIDSGVATGHPDLAAKILPGCDFYDDPNTSEDERDNDPNPGLPNGGSSEHGTHVAGIVAAVGNNNTGVAGVAFGPGVLIVPLKVFDDTGLKGTISGLIDSMLWASGFHVPGVEDNPNPVDVINMSVGAGPGRIPAIDDAAAAASGAGVVLFASAGNDARGDFSPGVQSPANAPDVIAVGSVDADYTRSSFSDFDANGPSVAMMAPGGVGASSCAGVMSTFSSKAPLYSCLSGTSMASPFAAGVAALLLSQNANLTPDLILGRLQTTSYFDDGFMSLSEYGAGVICADRALDNDATKSTLRCGE